jgi:hypothetical protein
MEELDRYLTELSELYSYDKFFRLSAESVIDRLLEIRNSMENMKPREIIIDGDELSKYFRGNKRSKDASLDD